MTQRFSLYEDLTIRENLDFVARLYAPEAARRLCRRDARRGSASTNRQRPARRHALRRLEAAPGARRLRHAPAAAPAPRRADGRRRPEGAARVLGRDPPARRRRADRARLDPLHGRGRALPPHRLHRLRQGGRARHRAGGDRRSPGCTPSSSRGGDTRGDRAPAARTCDGVEQVGAVRQRPACRRHRPGAPRARASTTAIAGTGADGGGGRDQPRGRLHPPDGRRRSTTSPTARQAPS